MRSFAIAAVLTTAAAAAALAQGDYPSLPPGPGRDVTVRVCAQCHSPELASAQRLDPQGWKDLVAQMANNGAQATDAEFATISQYLSTSFPSGAMPATAAPAGGAAPAEGAAAAAPGAMMPAAPADGAAMPPAAPADGTAAPAAPAAGAMPAAPADGTAIPPAAPADGATPPATPPAQ